MPENKQTGIAEGWNAGFVEGEEWETKPREHLWASELGNAPIDLFLRLKGEKPSNPPNERAKRKMGAGLDWEFTIEQILATAGILVAKQVRCEYQFEGLLKVTGKCDFMIGGKVNIEAAQKYLEEGRAYISPNRARAAMNAIKYYQKNYPNGFKQHPDELKSISDYAMDMMEKSNRPILRNELQLLHYLVSLDHNVGTLSYLNRNDERMMEFSIYKTEESIKKYRKPIEIFSKYWYANETPPLEKLVIWDEEQGRFSKNLNVSYSNYLTRLYGFKEPREYDEPYGKKAGNWNRVMTRMAQGKTMTKKNEEILKEITDTGFVPKDLISRFTASPEEAGAEEESL